MSDTEPRIVMTGNELRVLYSTVPQWCGEAIGPPVPFGNGRLARVEVVCIFQVEREDAERAVHHWIERTCSDQRMEYDPDEWRITSLVLLNGC